jgi:uncharacterized protein YidB (DUF937 family)
MDGSLRRKVVAGAAAALAVGGAGAAIAATKLSHSPSAESKALITDAAKQLGVEPGQLSSALKKALEDRVDAAVADGSITKAEGDAMKKRIESGNVPLIVPSLGFRHFGFEHHGPPGLAAAAGYLGLTQAQLESKLESGKTLAQVAKDEGKSVDGLVAALKADLQKKLDAAVSAGSLTKTQEAQILKDADQRFQELVNGKFPARPPGGRGWFQHRDGPGFGFRGAPGGAPSAGFDGPSL